MHMDWKDLVSELQEPLRQLRNGAPDVMRNFSGMAQGALKPTAIDPKTKELIALAIGVAIRCDDCIAFHAKAAMQNGATRDEVLETLGHGHLHGRGPVRHVRQSRH